MVGIDPSEFDEDAEARLRSYFGPGQVDQVVRQALQLCWSSLPRDKRNVDELKRQMDRLVQRAIDDMKEDMQEFDF